MAQQLKGRHVLVSGASSGIGEGLAFAAAMAGAKVTTTARRTERLNVLVERIRAAGGQAQAVAADVADEASLVAGFDEAEQGFGSVDTAYANAGVSIGGPALAMQATDLDALFAVNVRGAFLTAREAARRMIAAGSAERGHGRIVLVASIGAQKPLAGLSLYCASKAAVVMMGRSLAREWINQGVNVNVVCPGYLETEMTSDWFESERGRRQLESFPRRRLIAAGGIDPVLLLLGSDEARFLTGGVHVADDGQAL